MTVDGREIPIKSGECSFVLARSIIELDPLGDDPVFLAPFEGTATITIPRAVWYKPWTWKNRKKARQFDRFLDAIRDQNTWRVSWP
jgi:hypothetical protein